MASLTDEERAALEAIGAKGATLDQAAELGLSPQALVNLVDRGLLRTQRIELRETVDGAGAESRGHVDIFMLTDAGAEAIGVEPRRVGLA